ncbi:MAG: proton/sodium-translocating pyrophosphatase, partial [Methylococcales bacterium]
VFGLISIDWINSQSAGNQRMQEIGSAIQQGAQAYLNRQYKTIAIVGIALFFVIGFALDWVTAFGFAVGAALSGAAGYIGMNISVRANTRTAQAAYQGLDAAFQVAFRGGAITGMLVVGLGLFGVAVYYTFLVAAGVEDPLHAMVGLAFGGSLISIFARLGGGIFTKGADVGADLVGKVEAGIPEDDPRNPAVIADLVGDNVGDCAGRGADLFESTAAENIGAMILGVGLYPYFGLKGILFPLVARAFGLLASIVGVMIVKCREDEDPMNALNRGYYVTSALAIVGFFISAKWLLSVDPVAHPEATSAWFYFFLCGVIGILMAQSFVYITQYYTEYKYRPVRETAEASQTGPATNIITGIAVGLECTFPPVIMISIAILSAYFLGNASGVPNAGLFGTAVATMGMLGTAAYILAMDTFG